MSNPNFSNLRHSVRRALRKIRNSAEEIRDSDMGRSIDQGFWAEVRHIANKRFALYATGNPYNKNKVDVAVYRLDEGHEYAFVVRNVLTHTTLFLDDSREMLSSVIDEITEYIWSEIKP